MTDTSKYTAAEFDAVTSAVGNEADTIYEQTGRAAADLNEVTAAYNNREYYADTYGMTVERFVELLRLVYGGY